MEENYCSSILNVAKYKEHYDKIFKGKNPQYYFYIGVSWFKTSWQNVATRKKEQGVTFKIEKVCLKYEKIKTLSHQVSAMQFTET